MRRWDYDVLVIGSGHAGAEAAWAAANMGAAVGIITMDPSRTGQMSCNPAIGGLAKGQIVREIDALGGLMGLAADATGIQFRVLNASKGPAVRGPRSQNDKYAYAAEVQRLLSTRRNLTTLAGRVERLLIEDGRCVGVNYQPRRADGSFGETATLHAPAVVLTTGTFMRGLMHTGQRRTPGGRVGEQAAKGISGDLERLGFELGRLKTGTPPRLDADSLDFSAFETQPGDERPTPFSDMTGAADRSGKPRHGHASAFDTSAFDAPASEAYSKTHETFPVLEQTPCWITYTNRAIHERIRANLDRAPMYNGQLDAEFGPRYCPSIEDKVVRFPDKPHHHVFLEPESLQTNEIYCNGISTSLPEDVQETIVRNLPGCRGARILRYGYAVEYDMVRPHQIDATCMTKPYPGLFLAGQINGTTGYEEAAGQGVVAGINAVLYRRGEGPLRLRRDQAFIGVLMDDLVTKIPREPYRMFTSRAEHRLLLRSDNAPDRLTPLGRELGLIDEPRWAVHQRRAEALEALDRYAREAPSPSDEPKDHNLKLIDWLKRPEADERKLVELLRRRRPADVPAAGFDPRVALALVSRIKYAGFIERHRRQQQQLEKMESRTLPADLDYRTITGLRNEARQTLEKFRPATLGQAGRLAGITPADLTVLAFALDRGQDNAEPATAGQ